MGTEFLYLEDHADVRELVVETAEQHKARLSFDFFDFKNIKDLSIHIESNWLNLSKGKSKKLVLILDLDIGGDSKGVYDFIESVKSNCYLNTENRTSVPIIVFSQSDASEDIDKSYHMGVNFYVERGSGVSCKGQIEKILEMFTAVGTVPELKLCANDA